MECSNECKNEYRFKQIEEKLRKNSDDHEKFFDRIEKIEKDMTESRSDRKHINEKLEKIDSNVETLMMKPISRYETVVTSILTALVGGLIGFIVSGILPV